MLPQMSKKPPPVVPRKPSGVRVMMLPGEQLPAAVLPIYGHTNKENGEAEVFDHTLIHQEIMNHCFDDVERFMARLQQTAEAQT